MDKLLFITTRNVLNTCGELRLIKNRAKVLYEKWGIETDFIVLCSWKKIETQNEHIGYGSTMEKIGFNNNPLSIGSAFFCGKEAIRNRMSSQKYKCVILSGIGMLEYVDAIRKIDCSIPIIADIHGAKEELVEFNGGSFFKRLFKRALFHCVEHSENKYLDQLDGALVVSRALTRNLNTSYGLKKLKYYIVPCAIANTELEYENAMQYRKYYRSRYDFGIEDLILIYSGGVSAWQCIEKSIDIYDKLKAIYDEKIRMVILSHQLEEMQAIIGERGDIIIDRIDAADVGKALCAGDYALLIRENYVTNNVAYPNKFLEYVQSGMKIISTPYIIDVADQIKKFDLGIILDPEYDDEGLTDYMSLSRQKSSDWEKRNELLHSMSFENTLKEFVADMFGRDDFIEGDNK